ncbi:DUF397 domain-containing protein [Nocardiopsis sp. NPDC049922]|uniref:DUF397 domain-containing protein n=1 Tax=Nocardiopsis sp. NPDC049922 TaxID=3155157 RepID=UPI0033C0A3C6
MSGIGEIPRPSERRKRWDEPVRTGRDRVRATWRDGRDGTEWRKSSRSPNTGACCEASLRRPPGVLFRDSVHPDGHVLRFHTREWLSLLASLA